MDTRESSAPCARPSTGNRNDTVKAHYSGLERLRPHACVGGWVLVGYIDEHGEERGDSYRCSRCAESPGGQ